MGTKAFALCMRPSCCDERRLPAITGGRLGYLLSTPRVISLLVIGLLGACLAAVLASIVYDNRLPSGRKPGPHGWKVWWAPFRWTDSELYTPEGNRNRRLAIRYSFLAIVLGIAALTIRHYASGR